MPEPFAMSELAPRLMNAQGNIDVTLLRRAIMQRSSIDRNRCVSRVWNFSAGPAALPLPVLERAQRELVDWNGSGASVMEQSHRGKRFIAMAQQVEANLRALMDIPDNYA